MPIKIRQAANEDLPAILAFEQAVVAAERPYNNEVKDGTVQYYDMAALISSDQSRVLVAEDSGRLVATGHATLKSSSNYLNHDRHAYLGLMFVEPEYRGQGIVAQLGHIGEQGIFLCRFCHDILRLVYILPTSLGIS